MGAKRKSYTPKYRQEAAHLVIDTGRTVVAVARQIGVGEALLGGGWRSSGLGWMIRLGRLMRMSGPNWCGYAVKSRSCGWIGSS